MTATMGMGTVPRSGCTSVEVAATSTMVIAADTPGPAQMPALCFETALVCTRKLGTSAVLVFAREPYESKSRSRLINLQRNWIT
jgi:hypothetical protein